MYYLDIILLVNGVMDAFLVVFTAYLLRKKAYLPNILLAVLLGELPIIPVLYGLTTLEIISKLLVPVAMVVIGLRIRKPKELLKGLIYFNLLAAVCGGIYYVFAGWLNLSTEEVLFTANDLWFLLLIILLLVGGYKFWEKTQKRSLLLDKILYTVEISFGPNSNLQVKALLDTGNDLRDPLTGSPVLLLEQQAALKILPATIREFLELPWQQHPNPWSLIWNNEEYASQKLLFISAKGIGGQTWLPGIRVSKVKFNQGESEWEQGATVALVSQVLSKENEFQALLHPEHIQKIGNKEEIAS
ncbi:MAG: sigma-E processing peptidase SpoIIGA [Peptococcaceae bacterium]|jgi:stage II sporulation protein GA (sporulation sigma-E factor processing peptidase)|nr:sigma-E processing peptidase SpoIIGA [Peptococcaceae bacterium]